MAEVRDNIHNMMTALDDKEKETLAILENQVKECSTFENISEANSNVRLIFDDHQNMLRSEESSDSTEIYRYKHSWEGIELKQYWDKVGKILMSRKNKSITSVCVICNASSAFLQLAISSKFGVFSINVSRISLAIGSSSTITQVVFLAIF